MNIVSKHYAFIIDSLKTTQYKELKSRKLKILLSVQIIYDLFHPKSRKILVYDSIEYVLDTRKRYLLGSLSVSISEHTKPHINQTLFFLCFDLVRVTF